MNLKFFCICIIGILFQQQLSSMQFDEQLNMQLLDQFYEQNLSFETIKALLEKKADPNIQDSEGIAPMFHIDFKSDNALSVLKLLLDYNADPNLSDPQSMWPLAHTISCVEDNNKISEGIKLFCEYKGDLNILHRNQFAPLHTECSKNKLSSAVIKIFIEHKADPTIRSEVSHRTSLHWLCDTTSKHVELTPIKELFYFFILHPPSVRIADLQNIFNKKRYEDTMPEKIDIESNFGLDACGYFCFRNLINVVMTYLCCVNTLKGPTLKGHTMKLKIPKYLTFEILKPYIIDHEIVFKIAQFVMMRDEHNKTALCLARDRKDQIIVTFLEELIEIIPGSLEKIIALLEKK